MFNINKNILILKTSLFSQQEVEHAAMLLNNESLIENWSIDLEDCDKVLRIECYGLVEIDIAKLLQQAGVKVEELL